ncbi:hypothetical protein [Mycolicibacterium fortuitum]|uniref:hypothetical protein n=1 Tax=Mycolicibacterium fortuitum TaxID=1766 RepID=UPI0026328CBC|nr:hypothetical protein [Mycolicibacterium fortuitum]
MRDGQKHPGHAPSHPLCDACLDWAARVLGWLPNDWLKLKLSLGDTGGAAGEKVHSTPTPAVPLNVAADELMGYVVDVIKQADATLRYEMGMDPVPPVRRASPAEYRYIAEAVARIGPNVTRLADAPHRVWRNAAAAYTREWSGPDVITRAIDVHDQVRVHLGHTVQRERKQLPCPRCKVRALVKEVQDRRRQVAYSSDPELATPEVIRCLACHSEWTEAEYAWLSKWVLSEREEMELLKWLLAEAQWERDVNAWRAAELEWALADVARVIGLDGGAPELLEQVRRSVAQ